MWHDLPRQYRSCLWLWVDGLYSLLGAERDSGLHGHHVLRRVLHRGLRGLRRHGDDRLRSEHGSQPDELRFMRSRLHGERDVRGRRMRPCDVLPDLGQRSVRRNVHRHPDGWIELWRVRHRLSFGHDMHRGRVSLRGIGNDPVRLGLRQYAD